MLDVIHTKALFFCVRQYSVLFPMCSFEGHLVQPSEGDRKLFRSAGEELLRIMADQAAHSPHGRQLS